MSFVEGDKVHRIDPDGSIREWVGVHTDITEQREAEADLRESNDEIQRYAYIVSHDLRAPLVNVMGFTAELEVGLAAIRKLVGAVEDAQPALVGEDARLAVAEDMPEAVGFIRSSTAKMDRLINAILKLSREIGKNMDNELDG